MSLRDIFPRLLPCHYFLITFTVPREVRAALLAHPAEGYAALLTAAADSLKTLKYLAPYVIRRPVSDRRVTHCHEAESLDDAWLILEVKRSGSRRYRPMRLTVIEFIRRWLMHVLPAGLHRVRYYGFLSGSSKRSIEEVRLLIAVANELVYYLACSEQIVMLRPPKMACPECGGLLICLGYTPPEIVACTEMIPPPSRAPP